MAVFVVTMTFAEGWTKHLVAHVDFIRAGIAAGTALAAGPLADGERPGGCVVLDVADRAAVQRFAAADPLVVEGFVEAVAVQGWDPLFGALAARSSGNVAGLLARATG